MNQTLLALDLPSAAGAGVPDAADRVGFDIGWDHARHGLVPPPQLMLDGTPISQGWRAGRAVFGRRLRATGRGVRQWLDLRLRAWREGAGFEELQVTPHYLTQIETPHCPVTRAPRGGAPDSDDAPVIVRLRHDAGYAAGHLVVLSRRAAMAHRGRPAAQLLQIARQAARDPAAAPDGLDADQWARLAALASLVVELPQAMAARIALRVLPPNRVRVLNPAQGLQVLLTLRLQAAGWSRRARAVAELLPRPELRHDFNLFVGALAARLMAIPADADARAQRWALEDAWACGRVQRRWEQFAVQLSAAEAEALLQRLAASELGARRAFAARGLVLIGERDVERLRTTAVAVIATRRLDDHAVRIRAARRVRRGRRTAGRGLGDGFARRRTRSEDNEKHEGTHARSLARASMIARGRGSYGGSLSYATQSAGSVTHAWRRQS